MNSIKIPYIALSFFFSLLLLISSFFAYNQYFVIQPLHNLISEIEGVSDTEITSTLNKREIIIYLETDNLMGSYHEIINAVNEVVDSDIYTIEIKDDRNQLIIDKYNNLSFYVFEAIENNQYSAFNNIMDSVSKPYDLRIEMDENIIYVNLKNGEHYLYKLIPRKQNKLVT
ncbi:hypothetical protein [Desulfuribacillus alkaliarsenatis]|uniref:Uncharacterized protein n=1 Tax=Desulfuribacillus alkaliarsenatis TaxID=766136 RepID=A0A1E5FZN4_9FIRM|nr:hypothetical protein [Desulfuribacillus alkaliarsenatis]OEF95990.1 hypothetical protein BHF68_09575 [Desulfuribacillus alkaliarsenatis]